MPKLRNLIFCLLLLFLATLNHEHIRQTRFFHLDVDSSFSLEERLSIINAADRWERATNQAVVFDVVFTKIDENFNPFLGLIDSFEKKHVYTSSFVWNGQTDDPVFRLLEAVLRFPVVGFSPGPFIVLVPQRVNHNTFRKVAIHEIGHLIGLKHTSSIMDADYESASTCITEVDTQQFCKLYGCGSGPKPECINDHQ